MRWLITIKSGVANKTDLLAEYIGKQKDGAYILTIEKQQAKRSNAQNNFWHGVVCPLIADWMGELDPENVCRAVKIKLGYCKVVETKLGLKEWQCPSTAAMNKPDMTDFLFRVEALMSELTDGQFLFPRGDENHPY